MWREVEVRVLEIYPSPDGPRAFMVWTVEGREHWVSRPVGDNTWTEGQVLDGVCLADEPEVLGHPLTPRPPRP